MRFFSCLLLVCALWLCSTSQGFALSLAPDPEGPEFCAKSLKEDILNAVLTNTEFAMKNPTAATWEVQELNVSCYEHGSISNIKLVFSLPTSFSRYGIPFKYNVLVRAVNGAYVVYNPDGSSDMLEAEKHVIVQELLHKELKLAAGYGIKDGSVWDGNPRKWTSFTFGEDNENAAVIAIDEHGGAIQLGIADASELEKFNELFAALIKDQAELMRLFADDCDGKTGVSLFKANTQSSEMGRPNSEPTILYYTKLDCMMKKDVSLYFWVFPITGEYVAKAGSTLPAHDDVDLEVRGVIPAHLKEYFSSLVSHETVALWMNEASTVPMFSDIGLYHGNAEAIRALKQKGVIGGYPDGTFRPNVTVNRAEFTKLIIGAIQAPTDCSGSSFRDVPADAWFAAYVCAAKQMHLIDGYPDGTFKPESTITFSEAAKIVANAYADIIPACSGDECGTKQSSPWYEKYVRNLERMRAIPSTIASFDHRVTRGEIAEMLWRITQPTEELLPTYLGYEDVSPAAGKKIVRQGNLSFAVPADWQEMPAQGMAVKNIRLWKYVDTKGRTTASASCVGFNYPGEATRIVKERGNTNEGLFVSWQEESPDANIKALDWAKIYMQAGGRDSSCELNIMKHYVDEKSIAAIFDSVQANTAKLALMEKQTEEARLRAEAEMQASMPAAGWGTYSMNNVYSFDYPFQTWLTASEHSAGSPFGMTVAFMKGANRVATLRCPEEGVGYGMAYDVKTEERILHPEKGTGKYGATLWSLVPKSGADTKAFYIMFLHKGTFQDATENPMETFTDYCSMTFDSTVDADTVHKIFESAKVENTSSQ